MPVTTTLRVVDTLSIVRVDGELTADASGPGLERFRRIMDDVMAEAVDVAIELSQVDAIDSEGVGELARALTRVSRRGGRLALVAPTAQVRKVLAVTRLDTVFHVLPSEQGAIDVLVKGPDTFAAPEA